ncbi:hypothetical protein HYU14_03005 [Candidatus Woesearchaeota archaeon]|nr:hypothetical protein [Candidatus Woesearchaeota archaeon]
MDEEEFSRFLESNTGGIEGNNDWRIKGEEIIERSPGLFRVLAKKRFEAQRQGKWRLYDNLLHSSLEHNFWHGDRSFTRILLDEGLPFIRSATTSKEFEQWHHNIVTNPFCAAHIPEKKVSEILAKHRGWLRFIVEAIEKFERGSVLWSELFNCYGLKRYKTIEREGKAFGFLWRTKKKIEVEKNREDILRELKDLLR